MIVRRKSWRRFGASLAGVALMVQLALSSWGMLALRFAMDPAAGFGEHALCLAAGGTAQPDSPAQQAPAGPSHDHGAYCCLWHSLPAVQPAAVAIPAPVVYAAASRSHPGAVGFVSGQSHRPANARAPPALT